MTTNTPIFDQLSANMSELRDLAYKRGHIEARLELLNYIKEELKAKRLPASKGVQLIIEKLSDNE